MARLWGCVYYIPVKMLKFKNYNTDFQPIILAFDNNNLIIITQNKSFIC